MPPLPERLVVLKLFRQSREGNCISVFYRELKRFKKCELLILSGFILMLLCVSGVLTVLHLCMCVSTSAWALAWEHICCVYIWGSDRRVRYVVWLCMLWCWDDWAIWHWKGFCVSAAAAKGKWNENSSTSVLSETHRKGASGMSKGSQNV